MKVYSINDYVTDIKNIVNDKNDITSITDKIKPLSGAELIEYSELNTNGELQAGLLVTDVKEGSQAFLIGLQKADLIKTINRKPITSLKALKQTIDNENGTMLITVERNEQNFFLGTF